MFKASSASIQPTLQLMISCENIPSEAQILYKRLSQESSAHRRRVFHNISFARGWDDMLRPELPSSHTASFAANYSRIRDLRSSLARVRQAQKAGSYVFILTAGALLLLSLKSSTNWPFLSLTAPLQAHTRHLAESRWFDCANLNMLPRQTESLLFGHLVAELATWSSRVHSCIWDHTISEE